MNEEFELITYRHAHFHMFLVDLLYRTPHLHRDIEVSLILDGELDVIHPGGSEHMTSGDFFVTGPFTSHELSGRQPSRILSLQIPTTYFRTYFPQIETMEFSRSVFHHSEEPDLCQLIRDHMLDIASSYFSDHELKALACASQVNLLFLDLLKYCPYTVITEKERQKALTRGARMRRLTEYIDTHHEEKILLSDFAAKEGLDLYYLSHSFKDYFGISFQDYVSRVRCEHAGDLLLTTTFSILDISLRCGFSDPKYMKKGFLKHFGCTPAEYRDRYLPDARSGHKPDTITNQVVIDHALCLHILAEYIH